MSLSATCHRVVLLLAAAGGAALMLWTALGGWDFPPVGPKQEDYYNLLVSGFRKGSLALDLEVPPALQQMENPWDATKRPPDLAPHDVSYYHGHYYLYFGVVPAVLLFWPFKALTGCDLPFVWSAIVFGVGAYLGSAWLWLRLVRDQFPRAGLLTKLAGVAALGTVGGQLALERRVGMWEVPIEAGLCFMVGLMAAAYLALRSPRPWPWLAAAGLALGLAVGSRPNLIVAAPALAVLAAAVGARKRADGARVGRFRRTGAAAIAAGLPLAAVLAGLFAYNYARFGSLFEFGTIYQLSGGYDYRDRHFSISFLPYNVAVYFLYPPQWGRYFPFVHPIAPPTQPAGYYGIEYVYGALTICPLLWWLPWAAPGSGLRRKRPVLAAFIGLLIVTAAANTLMLLCFNVAAARYVADFLPWWVWLALIGWAQLETRMTFWAIAVRRGLRALFGACALLSCILALCASAEVHGVLRASNPAAYAGLARIFDAPIGWWERIAGYPGGALDMTVTFPEKPSGSVEPLVVTGVEYQQDCVYVFYTDARRIQLGYDTILERTPTLVTPVLAVTPGRPYRLHVETGPLFPPMGHPFYQGWTDPEVRALTQWVRIDLDGRTVLNRTAPADEASPGSLKIGRDRPGGLYGERFSGTISDVIRTARPHRRTARRGPGDVWLDVGFPPDGPTGSQPLVAAGTPPLAELVGLRMVDDNHFVLAHEIWGSGMWESGALPVPAGRRGTFRIRLGQALGIDPRSPLGSLSRSLVVWLDQNPVWWRRETAAIPELGSNPKLAVAENVIGSSAMAKAFTGRLEAWGRGPAPPVWHSGPFGAIEMFLAGRGRGVEPLLSTGAPGRDELLEVEWLPGERARLSYAHVRKSWVTSPVFAWPAAGVHRLHLVAPALAALDAPGGLATGSLRVDLYGNNVWTASVPYFPAFSDSLTLAGYGGLSPDAPGVTLGSIVLDIQQEQVATGGRSP